MNSVYSDRVIEINTDNSIAPSPGDNIFVTRNNVARTLEASDDAPLVTIYVVGYNNLEKYTKTCVDCILKYTQNIDYELILVDNGSSDGTYDYFMTVKHPRKTVIRITKNLGAFYGSNSALSIARGKFLVGISNDIYVTQNWLDNLLKCALSDERIGMVVPTSDNVSNLQDPGLEFTDFDDMQVKAAQYNRSDSRKWHERLRLIPSLALFNKVCIDMMGFSDYGFFHDFADDDLSFRVRRAGYKSILCKDVFVRHAGNTTRDPKAFQESLEKGRVVFREKYYGIDAWDDVNNYESLMMALLNTDIKYLAASPNVLGVDVLCGTPLLEVKNRLREQDVINTRLSAYTTKAKYWLDLMTICDGKVEVDRMDYILEHFNNEKFDYIILGEHLNKYTQPFSLLQNLLCLLAPDGQLLLKLKNSYDIGTMLRTFGYNISDEDSPVHHIFLEELEQELRSRGFSIRNITIDQHVFNNEISDLLKSVSFTDNSAYLKATAKEYIISIER